jgi:hypothetical protein
VPLKAGNRSSRREASQRRRASGRCSLPAQAAGERARAACASRGTSVASELEEGSAGDGPGGGGSTGAPSGTAAYWIGAVLPARYRPSTAVKLGAEKLGAVVGQFCQRNYGAALNCLLFPFSF